VTILINCIPYIQYPRVQQWRLTIYELNCNSRLIFLSFCDQIYNQLHLLSSYRNIIFVHNVHAALSAMGILQHVLTHDSTSRYRVGLHASLCFSCLYMWISLRCYTFQYHVHTWSQGGCNQLQPHGSKYNTVVTCFETTWWCAIVARQFINKPAKINCEQISPYVGWTPILGISLHRS
jgi:hypothetical protein